VNGVEWLEKMQHSEAARANIPLELQVTLPLPGKNGTRTAECWYYRLELQPDGPYVFSPERYVLWDVDAMDILAMQAMPPQPLGSGMDVLTKAHREREDAYLNVAFTEFLNGGESDRVRDEGEWIAAAPQAMREWLSKELKEED